jgi:uncharacterized membrane-anchored protein
MSKKHFSSIKDKYTLQARYFPAILTVFPFVFLINTLRKYFVTAALEGVLFFIPYLVQAGLSGAAFYFQMQLNRFLSKEIFQNRIFKGENNLPTTLCLLWSDNTIDNTIKQMIYTRIKSFFDISLLTSEAENKDKDHAKRLIIFAVSQIKNSLRKNDQQVQHNREYGFWRNLAGGSLVAVCISLIIIVIEFIKCNVFSIVIGFIMLLIYGLILCFSPYLIRKHGQYYAKSLFEQFLSLKERETHNDE